MENELKKFLIEEGYSEITPSGNKSTVYDYIIRVKRIMSWENLTWNELASGISYIEQKYDVGGELEVIGKKSHSAYINAIRAFKRFCENKL